MSIRNEIESFIEGIIREGTLSRSEIVELAQAAYIAPIMVDLLGFLPDGSYDEEGLVSALNALIRERKLEDLTGGLVRVRSRAG